MINEKCDICGNNIDDFNSVKTKHIGKVCHDCYGLYRDKPFEKIK